MSLLEKCEIINFRESGDQNGKLIAIEGNKNIPFDIKRIFYIYGSNSDAIRGQHANRDSEFVLINVSGKCAIKLKNGKNERIVYLDKPNKGLYIPRMVWKDMYDFSKDSVLLVLANTYYNKDEYIKDFNEYLSIMEEKI
ncbi:MAG: FdtA/QdtA family cupin domain-containing protein [Bacilli bacterium]|nr:FdtA/QdtA family cupin domain-containing protein [Bacilli bacterium]